MRQKHTQERAHRASQGEFMTMLIDHTVDHPSDPQSKSDLKRHRSSLRDTKEAKAHKSPYKADQKIAFLDHIQELRVRLVRCCWAFAVGSVLGYWQSHALLESLARPLLRMFGAHSGRTFIYTGLVEAFVTHLKIAMFTGVACAVPLIAQQIWSFIQPAIPKRDQILYRVLIVCAPLLFVMGACLAYFFICPYAFSFFLAFESTSPNLPLVFQARISEYISFLLSLMTGFGLGFQLPIGLALSVTLGWIRLDTLKKGRKYAFLIITILSAIITPPDLISPLGLMVPLYALYEASLWGLALWARRRHADGFNS